MIENKAFNELDNLVTTINKNRDSYTDEDILKAKDIIRGYQLDGKITNEEEYFLLNKMPSIGSFEEETYNPEEEALNIKSGLDDIGEGPLGNMYYNQDDDKTIEEKKKASFEDLMSEPIGNQFYNQDDETRTSFKDTIKTNTVKKGFLDIMDEPLGEKYYNENDDNRSSFSDTIAPTNKKNSGFGALMGDDNDLSEFKDDYDENTEDTYVNPYSNKKKNIGFNGLINMDE